MIRRLDPRTVGGSALVAAGIVSITAALVATGPTPARAAFVPTNVWLTIHLSDSAAGDLPQGSKVTITATIADSSTTTVVTNGGTPTTVTVSASANPTVSYSLSTNEVSFLSGGGGAYGCFTASGNSQPTCAKDGSIAVGSTDTQTIVVTVTGSPGDNANATASVRGNGTEANHAGSSATATDHAFIANVGAYTNEAPAGCFARKVDSDQDVQNGPLPVRARLVSGPQTFRFSDGAVTITVTVPAGALPNGTILSLYAGDPACWNSKISSASSSHTMADAYAVGWAFSGSTSFDASSTIVISVSDAKDRAGDPLFGTNKSGLGSQVGTASSGGWAQGFTADPGFVLAQAAAVVTTSSTPSTSSSATTTLAPPAGGGAPVARQASPVPLALGILAIVGGAGLVGTRRRRRPQ